MTRVLRHLIALSALAAASACVMPDRTPDLPAPKPPAVVEPVVVDDPAFPQQCHDIWQQELGRAIDPAGLVGCLDQFRRGESGDAVRAVVRASEEYKARQIAIAEAAAAVANLKPFRVDGRDWKIGDTPALPVLDDCLAILVLTPEARRAKLDEIQRNGFIGCRVFAGHLPWTTPVQTVELARANLPALFDDAAARGLYLWPAAVTDSRAGGYDVPNHLRAIAAIVRGRGNLVGVQCANEYWHPSQTSDVNNADWLASVCGPIMESAGVPWDLGAPEFDEPLPDGSWPIPSGSFIGLHLDRGRDKWNQVRRIRELYAVAEATRKPVCNGEMMGAGEVLQPGKRETDASFFFAAGVLGRAFKICGVFHSEDGLFARPLGPVQTAAARAFVDGYAAIPADFNGQYQNVGWSGSPIQFAQFTDAGGPIVRAYSFVAGDQAFVVVIHTSADLPADALAWAPGWHSELRTRRPNVTVLWAHR